MREWIDKLTILFIIAVSILFILLVVLAVVYMVSRKNEQKNEVNTSGEGPDSVKEKSKTFAVESVFDFMEFDKIEDNMITQKNGAKYVMIVECQGINYDLMSEVEKNAVEEGFIQFLNTIRHPIQIYTQTRTINLESSIQTYKNKVREIEEKLEKQEMKYREMVKSEQYSKEQLDKAYYELVKQRNLNEYGKDIIYTTERMSLNKNVLNQKYYIIIPYYPEELGQNDFDKEEIKNMAFSELYTRSQSILRTLSVCGINGKILNSNELADLLYVAYNRDESEVFGLDKAIKAGYDELYSTAPDVLDKKMRELDKMINEKAMKLASEKVYEAKSEKQKELEKKEENVDDLISQLAKLVVRQNRSSIGASVAKRAVEKIDEETTKKKRGRKKKTDLNNEEGGTKADVKEEGKRTENKTA